MRRELEKLFGKTGMAGSMAVLVLLRCPFDAMLNTCLAAFLMSGFQAVQHGSVSELLKVCLFFGLVNGLLFLYNGTVWTIFASHGVTWTGKIRERVMAHAGRISPEQFDRITPGEWFTRLNTDVRQASGLFNQPLHLVHGAVAPINLMVSGFLLFKSSSMIFVLTLLFLVPYLILSRSILAKRADCLSGKIREATTENMSAMNALTACEETAVLYDAYPMLLERFKKSSSLLRRASLRLRLVHAINAGLFPIAGMGGFLAVLAFMSMAAGESLLSLPELAAAFQYRGGVYSSTMMLAACMVNIRAAAPGLRRINETFGIPLEEEGLWKSN